MTASPGVPAEDYCLGVLRRHRDSMTRPDFQSVADDCGLYAHQVEKLWEQLLAGRAQKPSTPSTGSPVIKAVPPELARSQGQPAEGSPTAWQAAEDHPSARIRAKYRRAAAAVADLEQALATEAEKDKLRARKARLEEQLAKVKAELATPTNPALPAVPTQCPKCGKHFSGGHGLVMHKARRPECKS